MSVTQTIAIRATIDRMERHGVIYNANGDEMDPRWKLTNP